MEGKRGALREYDEARRSLTRETDRESAKSSPVPPKKKTTKDQSGKKSKSKLVKAAKKKRGGGDLWRAKCGEEREQYRVVVS